MLNKKYEINVRLKYTLVSQIFGKQRAPAVLIFDK
jgi:hypothetical protein